MDERIREEFERYTDEGLEQIIISNSSDKTISKIKIRPVLLRNELLFQTEEFRGTQVFHTNVTAEQLSGQLPLWFEGLMHQAELHHRTADVTILISKKGTVSVKCKKREFVACRQLPTHNREKRALLLEGTPVPFLRDLGVFTMDGKVVKGKYDKYRQINRFLEFIEDILPVLPKGDKPLSVLDFGCGKSYLTFAMYYYLNEVCGRNAVITGLDLKEDVIKNCNRLAEEYGYRNLTFIHGDVAGYRNGAGIDMMVTLHACDTATDYALSRAVEWGAKVILSVPCCQHEVNMQLSARALEPVLRYGLIKERMSALITDGLRAELLTAAGYRVQILEFIDMENTPKNLLIRAVKQEHPDPMECSLAEKRAEQLAEQLGIRPKLMELMNRT